MNKCLLLGALTALTMVGADCQDKKARTAVKNLDEKVNTLKETVDSTKKEVGEVKKEVKDGNTELAGKLDALQKQLQTHQNQFSAHVSPQNTNPHPGFYRIPGNGRPAAGGNAAVTDNQMMLMAVARKIQDHQDSERGLKGLVAYLDAAGFQSPKVAEMKEQLSKALAEKQELEKRLEKVKEDQRKADSAANKEKVDSLMKKVESLEKRHKGLIEMYGRQFRHGPALPVHIMPSPPRVTAKWHFEQSMRAHRRHKRYTGPSFGRIR